jgi:hypothetical protein
MKNAVLWDVKPCGSCMDDVSEVYFPPKRRFSQELPCVTSQKTAFFV